MDRVWCRVSPSHYLFIFFKGEYAGFDETQPTAESGGKGKVISLLKEKYGFKKIVMIGDGATDLEACPPAVSVHFPIINGIYKLLNVCDDLEYCSGS